MPSARNFTSLVDMHCALSSGSSVAEYEYHYVPFDADFGNMDRHQAEKTLRKYELRHVRVVCAFCCNASRPSHAPAHRASCYGPDRACFSYARAHPTRKISAFPSAATVWYVRPTLARALSFVPCAWR